MPLNINNQHRSDSYIGTFDLHSEQNELQSIKQMVHNLNGMLSNSGYDYRFYVKLKGNKSLLEDSDSADAYIYRRK